MSAANTWLTQSMTGSPAAEVGRELRRRRRRRARSGARPRGTSRCRPGGSGRSTASDRRRRRDDRARRGRRPTARCRPASSTRVGRGDAHGELDLDRVGVLELVEQEALVAVVQPGAHGRAVSPGRAAGRGRARAGRGTRAVRRRAARRRQPSVKRADGDAEPMGARLGDLAAHAARAPSPASTHPVPHVVEVEVQFAFRPTLPTLKLGALRVDVGSRASSSSSSSSMARSRVDVVGDRRRGARRAGRRRSRQSARSRADVVDLGQRGVEQRRGPAVAPARVRGHAFRRRGPSCPRRPRRARRAPRAARPQASRSRSVRSRAGSARSASRNGAPPALELDARADLVEHLDPWRKTRPRSGAPTGCAGRTSAACRSAAPSSWSSAVRQRGATSLGIARPSRFLRAPGGRGRAARRRPSR